jgi:hypothetical protein
MLIVTLRPNLLNTLASYVFCNLGSMFYFMVYNLSCMESFWMLVVLNIMR